MASLASLVSLTSLTSLGSMALVVRRVPMLFWCCLVMQKTES